MKLTKLKFLLPVLVLIILILPSIQPLFKTGFFTMHDDQQIVRLIQLDKSLKAGQFPVRWVEDLGFGYGYPLFIFYPPLVYYLGEFYLVFLGVSYITAMKLVFGTSFLAAALAMYFWIKPKFGTMAGLVAGLFYTYAPYRAVDAYVRGALAEAFSFVWLPLVLLSIDNLIKKPSLKWILSLAVSYGLLMITHNLIVLPFTIIMGLYIGLKLVSIPVKEWLSKLTPLFLAGFLGLGLSAFFWMPALAEKQFTIVDQILLSERYDHSLHYVAWSQLWNSLWGYGGSSPDLLDGFTLKIGKLHLISSFVAVVFVLFQLSFKKFNKLKIKNSKISFILISASLLAFSAWMTTASSSVIWDNFPPIQFLQFPWRFLTFTTLFSSALAGALVYLVFKIWDKYKPQKINIVHNQILQLGFVIGLISLLFLPNLKLFTPQTFLEVDDTFYQSDDFTKWQISKTSFEFVPKGVATTTDNDLGITQLAISREKIATQLIAPIENGEAEVEIITNLPHKKLIDINATQLSQITFNVFDFPGWNLYLNDKPVGINSNNDLKLISTLVPLGEHRLELIFENTFIRNLANSLSFISIGLVLVIGMYINRHKFSSK